MTKKSSAFVIALIMWAIFVLFVGFKAASYCVTYNLY